MPDRDLVAELNGAAAGRTDEVGDLLAAAADRIDTQAGEIAELQRELEETNEGMVALTVELQEAEQRYRALFENAVEGIYRLDPGSRGYEMANGAMASILGYDSSDALQAGVTDVREDVFVDTERFDEYESRLDERDSIEDFQYRVRRTDGEIRWVADNARVLYEDGESAGYRGGVIDITERKQYEERLETRTGELEALNRVLRHDVANDMQIVRGYANHLSENVAEEFRPQAEQIVTTADHVLEMTSDARQFVEAVTGEQEPELEPIAVADLLTYVLDRQRDAHPEGDHRIEGDLPDVEVMANEMLSSVFRNILSNAINHNDTDEPRVTVRAAVADGELEVRFTDNGPGIPDERKEQVFGKGEQSVDSEGTGIGLYLVNELVGNYDGEVHVEDRPDGERGSVFVVRLPVIED